MSTLDNRSTAAYRNGWDPLDWAVTIVAGRFQVAVTVAADRLEDPTAWPRYGSATCEAVANRVLGALLEAGWTPPRHRTSGCSR